MKRSKLRHDGLRRFTADLMRIARTYRREVDRRIRQHGLSDARAIAILHISRGGEGIRQGMLAEELSLEGPSLVRLIDQLASAGLVERRPDPSDGRARTLHLTAAGTTLAAEVEQILQELRVELLGGVSDADLDTTLKTFAALGEALERKARQPRS